MSVSSGTVFISSPQADKYERNSYTTRYSPKVMTWVIRPLSTCLPENIRDTSHADGHKSKEQSGIQGNSYFFGIHGYISACHAIWYGEQQQCDSCRDTFQQHKAVQ